MLLAMSVLSHAQSLKTVPRNWYRGKTLPITISGHKTQFSGGTGTSAVKFVQGSKTITTTITPSSFKVVNDSVITGSVTIPYSAPTSYYDAYVIDNKDGTVITNNSIFVNYKLSALLAKVYPDTIRQGQTLDINLYGTNTNFGVGTSTTSAWIQQSTNIINADTVKPVNDTFAIATFTIPSTALKGSYDVYVKNSFDTTMVKQKAMNISTKGLPSITAHSPDTSRQEQTFKMNITGSNTRFGKGKINTYVLLSLPKKARDTLTGYNYTFTTAGNMSCYFTIPKTLDTGYYSISIYDPYDGLLPVGQGFHIQTSGPRLIDISPPTGTNDATFSVSIAGYKTSFNTGKGPTVWIKHGSDSLVASTYSYVKKDTIICSFTAPISAKTGKYDLHVYDNKDSIMSLAGAFYLYPNNVVRVLNIAPAQLDADKPGTLTTLFYGTRYLGKPVKSAWLNRGQDTIKYLYSNALNDSLLKITFYIPNYAAGLYSLSVTDSKDDTVSLFNSVKIIPVVPRLDGILPVSAHRKQLVTMGIAGKYTSFASGGNRAYLVQSGDTLFSVKDSVVHDSLAYAYFDLPRNAAPGTYDLYYTDIKDKTLSMGKAFSILPAIPAQVVSASPDSLYQGESITLNLHGSYSYFGSGKDSVWLKKDTAVINPVSLTVKNDSLITALFNIPFTADTGKWDIYTSDLKDSIFSRRQGIFINVSPPPFIVSATPDSSYIGRSALLKITGFKTSFMSKTIAAYLTQGSFVIRASSLTPLSDNILRMNILVPVNAHTGWYNLEVADSADGTMIKNKAFYLYPALAAQPLITDIYPDTAYRSELLPVNITGARTHFSTVSNTIRLLKDKINYTAYNIDITDDSTLTAWFAIPETADTGTYDLTLINNKDHTLSYSNAVKVGTKPAGSLNSIAPDSAERGDTLTADITGLYTDMDSTKADDIVLVMGNTDSVKADAVMVVSAQHIRAHFTLKTLQAIGTYDLKIKNSYDILSLPKAFKVTASSKNPISITAVPDTALLGKGFPITINGINTGFDTSTRFYIVKGSERYDFVTDKIVSASVMKLSLTTSPSTTTVGAYTLKMISGRDGSFTASRPFYLWSNVGIDTPQRQVSFVKIYPVPFSDRLSGDISLEKISDIQLALTDETGKVIMNHDYLKQPGGKIHFDIPVSACLPSGIYYLSVKTSGKRDVIRLVKQ